MELVTHFNRNIVFAMLGMLSLAACKKAEDRSCFKATGKVAMRTVEIQEFDNLIVGQHFEVELIQDSLDKIEVIGGENLINLIQITEDAAEKSLTIKDENKCRFMRSYKKDKIKVIIHLTTLRNILYEGSQPLTGKIKSDYFTLLVSDGAGTVTLDMESIYINADVGHGWGDYTLTGTTHWATIALRSNGFCDVSQLAISDSVYVNNSSVGDIKLTANNIPIVGKISNFGNVYYTGIPTYTDVKSTSSGKLIDNN